MELSDALWQDKWRPLRYPKIVEGPIVGGCGCEDEPMSSLWCAAFAEAMGDRYGEGMRLLDYGCGYGRFFNFLTGRLATFKYFGLEVAGSSTGHGQACLAYARRTFGDDPRGRFGLVGSELEEQALGEVNVVLLASILTHLDFDTFKALLNKFLSVIARGGAVVFSVVHGDRYECVGPGKYGMPDCYHETHYTHQQLGDHFRNQCLALTEAEHFQAPVDLQTIYRAERASRTAPVGT
jgi:SAM-dependent methyltransferase